MKQQLHQLLNQERKFSKGYFFNLFIFLLIIVSSIGIIVETDKVFFENHNAYYSYFELGILVIFLLEYIGRIWVADLKHPNISPFKARLKFIFSFGGLVDLLAILSFIIPVLWVHDLRILRLFRLVRLGKLLKLVRYSKSFRLIARVFKSTRAELGVAFTFSFILIIITAYFMYQIENRYQPEVFRNYFDAIWWAIATLTTIGYGDIYPISTPGKILAAFVAMFGIAAIALPTGILSSAFLEEVQKDKKHKTCPHCHRKIS